jgi:hypothetical protein
MGLALAASLYVSVYHELRGEATGGFEPKALDEIAATVYSRAYNEKMVRNSAMEIETQSLTTCEVAPDGGAISLCFVDKEGRPATIRLSLSHVGARVQPLSDLTLKPH